MVYKHESHYTDDTKIYNVIKTTEDQQCLQHVINKLKEWCDQGSR